MRNASQAWAFEKGMMEAKGRYLGDSGHIGKSKSCNTAGKMAKPKRRGHPSFVPSICSIPNT